VPNLGFFASLKKDTASVQAKQTKKAAIKGKTLFRIEKGQHQKSEQHKQNHTVSQAQNQTKKPTKTTYSTFRNI